MDASLILLRATLIACILFSMKSISLEVDDMEDPLQFIEDYYANIHSIDNKAEKPKQLETLLKELGVEEISSKKNVTAEQLLAKGILTAAYAEIRGMKGLGDLKKAREYLIKSYEKDPNLLDGYAQAFLARLYCTLPGWPISWGSKKECKSLLAKTLDTNKSGLAINLYYGLYELDQGEATKAHSHLSSATKAPFPKVKYPLWHATLSLQIEDALNTIK